MAMDRSSKANDQSSHEGSGGGGRQNSDAPASHEIHQPETEVLSEDSRVRFESPAALSSDQNKEETEASRSSGRKQGSIEDWVKGVPDSNTSKRGVSALGSGSSGDSQEWKKGPLVKSQKVAQDTVAGRERRATGGNSSVLSDLSSAHPDMFPPLEEVEEGTRDHDEPSERNDDPREE